VYFAIYIHTHTLQVPSTLLVPGTDSRLSRCTTPRRRAASTHVGKRFPDATTIVGCIAWHHATKTANAYRINARWCDVGKKKKNINDRIFPPDRRCNPPFLVSLLALFAPLDAFGKHVSGNIDPIWQRVMRTSNGCIKREISLLTKAWDSITFFTLFLYCRIYRWKN